MSVFCYAVIHNIPKSFHAKTLRAFFSLFVEESRFDCFHFRHRPELKRMKNDADSLEVSDKLSSKNGETCCCFVRLTVENRRLFIKRYSGEHWTNEFVSEFAHLKCFITPIKFDNLTELDDAQVKNAKNLIEFNPPALMPQGNVGTPSEFFLDLIKSCRLPSSLIAKLGLTFVKSVNGRRTYGNVPMNYGETRKTKDVNEEEVARRQNPPDPDEGSDLDDDNCQEFERHEALNDDVTSQERIKEKRYEEEMEVVWEKGGPGLVFYTDSFHWEQEKGTDTDELWADDWDVDMSIYYGGAGEASKDSQDLLAIRRENMFRNGKLTESVFKKSKNRLENVRIEKHLDSNDHSSKVSFEKSSKGIARKVMERHGWRQGTSLGKTFVGSLTPAAVEMESDAQAPYSRKGLGYRGEKLQRFNLHKAPTKRAITTIYDEPDVQDPAENLIRREVSTHNKWRQKKIF